MKFQKILKLCKQRKRFVVYNGPDCQWIGDGSAIYPAYGAPKLSKEAIMTILDIPEEKWESYYFEEMFNPVWDGMNINDYSQNEEEIKDTDMQFVNGMGTVRAMPTSEGEIFVLEKYLDVVQDGETINLYLRSSDNNSPYIAIKSGFILMGMVMPTTIVNADFIKKLREITMRCEAAMRNKLAVKETDTQERLWQE